MSLLKHIHIAKNDPHNNAIGGWRHFDTWNLATVNFKTRAQAEKAYNATQEIYEDIVQNQTWDSLLKQGQSPNATDVSFRHHIWVDENDGGFTLCVSFDNGNQTKNFTTRAKNIIGEMKSDTFKILQGVSDKINNYMTATHSVEVDIVGVKTVKEFKKTFENGAQPTALYTDSIEKQDGKRYKAYFDSGKLAQEFSNRVRGNKVVLRRFPSAKSTQPKKPQVT